MRELHGGVSLRAVTREGIGILNDRVESTAGRFAAIARIAGRTGAKLPATLDEAHDDDSGDRRWLLTSCVAGIAGSMIAGAALLGVLSNTQGPSAMASVQAVDGLYAPAVKTDITGKILDAAALNPIAGTLPGTHAKAPPALVIPERDLSGDRNYPGISAGDLPYGDGRTVVLDAEIDFASVDPENITTITKSPPPEPVDELLKLDSETSLVAQLTDRGVTRGAAQSLLSALDQVFPAKMLKAGTEFEVTLEQQQDFYGRYVIFPVRLAFRPGPKETIVVEADEDGRFLARVDGEKDGMISRYARVDHFRTKARVGSGLYATAKDNKVPDYITSELARVFSYDVDFQRQVKSSDSFEVFYGNPLTGSSTKRKVLHYAQLILGGKARSLYRFTATDGQTDYYDENGRGATKSLLRTPVSGARLTSGFGMRRHPLMGYSKMHTGIDFGVPYGTPIRAAGSGRLEIAGRYGAYGIALKIQHTGKYETLYAHMSRLASGMRPGVQVRQGQVIGYVGSSGLSTGPHLHYEIRVADRAVNPMRVKASGARQLAGRDLKNFQQLKSRIAEMMQTAPSATRMAQVEE